MLPDPATRTDLLDKHKLTARSYVLATLHRPENVDHPATLDLLLTQLATIGTPIILPLHPRTARRIDEFHLTHRLAPLQTTEPLDYPDFLALAHSAAMLISDSGGVQEEASIVKTPIMIVRRSTERPEIEPTFGLRITPSRDLGVLARRWLHNRDRHHRYLADLPSPFGDGTASHRITHALDQLAQPQSISEPLISTSTPRPNQCR
jgi:UDP-N-acetylglucosamine 2-epimerase (non-hydrolysing)